MKRRNCTHTHTQRYEAPWRVLYNITPDISSDFTHLEAGQSSHLFSRSKIAASFVAVYYYYHYYHNYRVRLQFDFNGPQSSK